jgi:hypothetical protein
MPRPVEARLQALERALGTGQTDWAAMQREKNIEFCRSVLALYLNVPDPHNHPELCKQVARASSSPSIHSLPSASARRCRRTRRFASW